MWPFKPKVPRPPALEGVSLTLRTEHQTQVYFALERKHEGDTYRLTWNCATPKMVEAWLPVMEELQRLINQMEARSDSP